MSMTTRESLEKNIENLQVAIALETAELEGDQRKFDVLVDKHDELYRKLLPSNTMIFLQEQITLTHRIARRNDVLRRWNDDLESFQAQLQEYHGV